MVEANHFNEIAGFRPDVVPSTPVAYLGLVIRFIETPVFTRQIVEIMDDAEYSRLQTAPGLAT